MERTLSVSYPLIYLILESEFVIVNERARSEVALRVHEQIVRTEVGQGESGNIMI